MRRPLLQMFIFSSVLFSTLQFLSQDYFVVELTIMSEPSSRRREFERENKLCELFIASNDVSIIKSHQTNQISWWMALGRYLKAVRNNPNPSLYPFLKQLLDDDLPVTRELFLILKQCVHLYPEKLTHLFFQRHLSNALSNMTDPYLRYKYVRLLRLIIEHTEEKHLTKIFPSTIHLLEKYTQLDSSIIIVLEKLVLIHSDSQLQLSLNDILRPSLIQYFQSNDFDDDEIIDLCYLLFQINLNPSLQCLFHISNIFIDLLIYIDYNIDTMINWLLTPETGDKFLILILRLIKYLSSHRDDLQLHANEEIYDRIILTIKQFHEQLKTAHEKSLFPYNIKPLLNAFNLF